MGPLPAGTYRVSAHVPGLGTVEREVTVSPGQSQPLRLESRAHSRAPMIPISAAEAHAPSLTSERTRTRR